MAAARESAPHLPRALLLDGLRAGWLAEAKALGCVAVVVDHPSLDAAVIDQLHAADMRALSYTVNDPFTAQQLIGLGIDGLITDAVDRFSPGTAAVG